MITDVLGEDFLVNLALFVIVMIWFAPWIILTNEIMKKLVDMRNKQEMDRDAF